MNVFNMVKNLGLKVNINEAQVLLASADKNMSGTLTIDEFMDLIFNQKDNLNAINLKNLPNLENGENPDKVNPEIIHILTENAKNVEKKKQRKILSLIFKNKLGFVNNCFSHEDPINSGYVKIDKINKIFDSVDIPTEFFDEEERKRLINLYKRSDKFHYHSFIDDLNKFDYNPNNQIVKNFIS